MNKISSKMMVAWAVIFAAGVLLGIAVTKTNNNEVDSAPTSPTMKNCTALGKKFDVTIENDKVTPATTNGHLCDTITFTNKDDVTREVAFGPHEDHVPYDGVPDKVLNLDQSFTITLNKTGSYHFHDHLHDEVQGYFNVSK